MSSRISCVSALVVLYILFCLGGGIFTAEIALHPFRRALVNQKIAPDQLDVTVHSPDGLSLRAWYIRPARSNGNAVILLHGVGDNRMGMTGYAHLLLNAGYGVLLPDSRAHGASDGTLATYGLSERQDIHLWVNWLEQQGPGCVFGFGESMGAAQLLQSLAIERRFCAIAVESPFSDFREIAYDRVGQFFHSGPWVGRYALRPLVEVSFLYARLKYGFDMGQVNPAEVVASSSTPVLLIHGMSDRNIPLRHSRLIQIRNAAVILWQVPATDHCGAIATHPAEFRERLLDWFSSHSPQAVSSRVR